MIGISVSLVIYRHYVHQHAVLGIWVKAGEGHTDGGEHSSEIREDCGYICISACVWCYYDL